MAIDGIIFTGVDPLVSIYMYRSSHFHHVVIAPVMTDLSPKQRLFMLQIATSLALLVPSQNLKSTGCSPPSPLVSSPAELVLIYYCVVGLPCACLLRSLFSFTPNAVYVHSPVIPCTYLLSVSDGAFTVLFVQLCLVPCDVLTILNHALFRCLVGPELPDGPRLCCSLGQECTGEPVLSLVPPSSIST